MSRQAPMLIPVITYHSHRMRGSAYETNDHVRLATDLQLLHFRQFTVVPLHWVAEWVVGLRSALPRRSIALTFDDGVDFDYFDCEQERRGLLPSFLTVLMRFADSVGASQPFLEATAFVIASADARQRIGGNGPGLLSDTWWPNAVASGLIAIQNHSWDHSHPKAVGRMCSGFHRIRSYDECDLQVRRAGQAIRERAPSHRPLLFAFPYGRASRYLRQVYLPRYQDEHGMLAAFSTDPGYVTRGSNRWWLPRFAGVRRWPRPFRPRDFDTLLRRAEES